MALKMQAVEYAQKDDGIKDEGLNISQPEMPDSDDSFWNPLIKEEPVEPEDVMPGEATSSFCPPHYMRSVPVVGTADDDMSLDEDYPLDLGPDSAFSQPPDENAFLGVDHEDADDESDFCFVDECCVSSPWNEPPDTDTFLGGNPFLVSEQGDDEQDQTLLERELEDLLLNPVESD